MQLGALPIRFLIMRRKLAFLQYILKQDKNSTLYQVLKMTKENPVKNDFVLTCEKYLKNLDIHLSMVEISKLSKNRFNRIIKGKVKNSSSEVPK